MASVANIVRFLPASGSTGDFVYSSGVTGYRTPVSSPALTDGATYRYRAESADLSEWEVGEGTWTTATSTLARTTIIHSSTGAKVNFTVAPNVAIVALADQFINPAGDTMTGALVVPNASGLKIKDTDASHTLGLVGGSNLTADRTLTLTTGDASRTITLGGDLTTSGAYNVTLTLTATSNLTMPAGTKTLAALEDGNTFTTSQSIHGGLTLTSSTAYNPQLNITHDSNTAGSAGYYLLNRARSGMTDVQASDALGTIGASGYFNGAIRLAGYFAWSVDGAPSGSTVYTKLVYATVSAGNVFAIDKDGKVGVKTTSPSTDLEVVGTAKATTLNLTNALGVAYGGTGATSLTANYALLGNGTGALQAVAPGASGNVFTSNGTTWTSAAPTASGGKAADQQVFTSSGTWTKPSGFGAKAIARIQCWGAGGGGSRSASTSSLSGGGGGQYSELYILLSSLGATETVTIGAGGAGRTASSGDGTAGGDTTFGSWLTGYGGGGGSQSGFGASGGSPTGAGVAGSTNNYVSGSLANDGATYVLPALPAWQGGFGKGATGRPSITRADALMGGGGGGSANSTAGGASFGGGAGGTAAATAGAGTQPGGGGASSTSANTNGGNGGAGKCVVTVFDGA